MKLPNGFGSVYKLNGNRRRPYIAVVSKNYYVTTNELKRKREILGYFITKEEALIALTNYHENPYDINLDMITFEEVYKRWSEDHFKRLSNKSSIRTYSSAFNHSKPIHKMKFADIRPNHLEGTIEHAQVGDATKSRTKSMYNLMYKYAMKYDIVEKNYAELCNSVKVIRQKEKIPFTVDEVNKLWEMKDKINFVDMILFAIYSGFRPVELTMIRIKDVHLDKGYIIGGTKTKAGTNRIVPIHPKINGIIEKRYEENNEFLFSDYNMFEQEICGLSYDKYRGRFGKIMKALKMIHTPH